ncbi:hypothetical protein K491DRAFT_259929 [Lophiostoma macrostomum CBS 122681]|uniref:Uncharacterized protein n=1 Tax=Lophiostoma macrostomum CBS 122681 TaxID=1314788 RepID=A0A6A6TIW7_9PLEO|nr:hypothetical protein K491DRAFT_259929 [Lophiostoma macrostomum CBS 122681]
MRLKKLNCPYSVPAMGRVWGSATHVEPAARAFGTIHSTFRLLPALRSANEQGRILKAPVCSFVISCLQLVLFGQRQRSAACLAERINFSRVLLHKGFWGGDSGDRAETVLHDLHAGASDMWIGALLSGLVLINLGHPPQADRYLHTLGRDPSSRAWSLTSLSNT